MESTELKHKTFHAVVWALVRVGTSNVVSFVVFTVLARILSPRDFGVFALAILVVDVARIVSSAGLSDAITRDKHRDELLADTAFWANIGLGCIVGAATWLLAPLYAMAIDQPEIIPVVRCLAVLVPVSSLSGIHTARKLAEFGHKAVAARMMSSSALGGAAAVTAAIAGLGVWSLVIQTAIVDVVGIIFAWQTYPWRPRLRFDSRRLWDVCGFSGIMMLTQVLGMLLTRIQDIVIGRYISVAAVGTYRIAWRMIDLIAQTTIQPLVGVSFVTLSQLQDDRERFRQAFLRMLGLGALFTFPAIAGFGVLSGEIIPLLFGAKWAASADIAKILTLMAIPFSMNFFIGPALAAIGRSTTIAKGSVVQTAATLALSMLAAPFGLQWVAAAYVFRAYLTMPYHLALFRRDTGIGLVAMMRAIMPPFLASLGMAAALLLVAPYLENILGHGVAYLAVMVPLGCTVFMIGLLLFAADYIRSNLAALLPVWRRLQPKLRRQNVMR
jgi:O-antigen/teichoic acid export membrane protein